MSEGPSWAVVERLLRVSDRRDLDEIRALTRDAIAAIQADEDRGCGDELYALCFLLYLVGDPADVALVYAAKYLNMDTGCMIAGGLLTMGRDRETMMRAIDALPLATRPHLARDLALAFDAPLHASEAARAQTLRSYFGIERATGDDAGGAGAEREA